MKWVQIRPGLQKLVDDSDERPAIKIPERDWKKRTTFHTTYTPSWKRFEEGMKSQDSATQEESADKFLAEREHQIKTDPQARKWEESRKKYFEKEKPKWRQEMIKKGMF